MEFSNRIDSIFEALGWRMDPRVKMPYDPWETFRNKYKFKYLSRQEKDMWSSIGQGPRYRYSADTEFGTVELQQWGEESKLHATLLFKHTYKNNRYSFVIPGHQPELTINEAELALKYADKFWMLFDRLMDATAMYKDPIDIFIRGASTFVLEMPPLYSPKIGSLDDIEDKFVKPRAAYYNYVDVPFKDLDDIDATYQKIIKLITDR